RFKRKSNVGSRLGLHRFRNEVKPLEAQNVIEPNGARKLHRRAQQITKRLASALDQGRRIDAGKPPTLPLGVELIALCAALERRQDQILIVPGIEPVRSHTDRNVEIESDRQPCVMRLVPASRELPVRDPLDEFEIAKLFAARRLKGLQ